MTEKSLEYFKNRLSKTLSDKRREAYQDAVEALEKQLSKKPKEMKYKPLRDFGWKYECPICRGACGENVYHYDITKDEMYCTTCGQKLDWSE